MQSDNPEPSLGNMLASRGSDLLLNPDGSVVRVGFLTRRDARNRRTWSGIFHYMATALERNVGQVVHLGPEQSYITESIVDNTNCLNDRWRRLTGNSLMLDENRLLALRLAYTFRKKLKHTPCDILFAPVASIESAFLKTEHPIVYFSDITWELIVDYYTNFSCLSRLGRTEGEKVEAAALKNATARVFPSQWTLESACGHYRAPRDSSFIVAMGANLDNPPPRELAARRSLEIPIQLLLVGVDWERKGGPIAFECLRALLDRGVDARLTICGCIPPSPFFHSKMRVIPFLDKRNSEHREQLSILYRQAHFMLFPTRAEALGVVTCEASANGLPTLGANTGGVSGALRDGINGYLLPFEARGDAYADKICELLKSPDAYKKLAVSSRSEYETRLNWDAWANGMRSVFEFALRKTRHSSQ